jgi:hypothetical protein
MEKHVPSFDEFLSEKYNTAFDVSRTKHIKFLLGGWDHFDRNNGKKTFYFHFDTKGDKISAKDLEKKIMKALADEEKTAPNDSLSKIKKEFGENEFHPVQLALSNLKGNYSGLTYAFKALDSLYGEFGAGMGWVGR